MPAGYIFFSGSSPTFYTLTPGDRSRPEPHQENAAVVNALQRHAAVSGLLVEDPSDLAAFGALLRRVLRDATLARQLGQAAYQRVRQHFLHTHHLSMWVTLLAHLLGRREADWEPLDSSVVLPTGTG